MMKLLVSLGKEASSVTYQSLSKFTVNENIKVLITTIIVMSRFGATQSSTTGIARRKLFSRDVFASVRHQSIAVCPAVVKAHLRVNIVTLRLLTASVSPRGYSQVKLENWA